ncbi:hypothetical protein Q5P01_000812 [Channa striata]|uniref:Uncharacterized protein n=1 Tax=Channa striata TaxID=64152 RepID=A0AA88LN32_CHASR|nr:hypothetical protein Q5P01_000812 [Channa striata]
MIFLDAHYLYVRPDCVRENVDDDGKFFISPKGRPIRSASNDLSRLHAHYKIPSVTSQEIQRVVETAASTAFNEEQKAMVAHYMAHSTPVANTHYRLRTAICTTAVCASLAGYRSEYKTTFHNQLFSHLGERPDEKMDEGDSGESHTRKGKGKVLFTNLQCLVGCFLKCM